MRRRSLPWERCIFPGEGVGQNIAEAVKGLRCATEQGLVECREWLGYLYSEGEGVGQDNREAVKSFRLADVQGSELARRCLENVYADFG